jgi:uncharacterized membrane protein
MTSPVDTPTAPAINGEDILRRHPIPGTDAGLEKLPNKLPFLIGAAVALFGVKQRGLVGLFSAGVSMGLMYQGARQNGLLDGGWKRHLLHTRSHRLIPFGRQMIYDEPPELVYERWRNLDDLAIYMPSIRDIEILDERRSRWSLKVADNLCLHWTAELLEDRPDLMVWRVEEPSDLYHEGWIRFEPLRNGRSTRVTLRLYLLAPGGDLGAHLVRRLEALPLRYFADDLQRFRQVVEGRLEDLTDSETS